MQEANGATWALCMMNMFLHDINVTADNIKWSVIEPLVTEATAVLHAYQAGTLTLLAPDLIYAELGNIV